MRHKASVLDFTWPPTRAYCDQWREAHRYRPLRTSVAGGQDGLAFGKTAWGRPLRAGIIALVWDWAEVRKGIPALADPLSISSNVQFLDADGAPLEPRQQVLHLNMLVHKLPWQEHVSKLARGRRDIRNPANAERWLSASAG